MHIIIFNNNIIELISVEYAGIVLFFCINSNLGNVLA